MVKTVCGWSPGGDLSRPRAPISIATCTVVSPRQHTSMKIEAGRCNKKADAQACKSGQRYGIAVQAGFGDLGRCSEHDTTKNFDSDLAEQGEDQGASLDMSKKRCGRDQWWLGQWWPSMQWGGYNDHHNGNGRRTPRSIFLI